MRIYSGTTFLTGTSPSRLGSAGLRSALVTPERRILPWEGAGRTEGSSKSLLFSAFTRVASNSELALHSKNLWESRLTPPNTHPPPYTRAEGIGVNQQGNLWCETLKRRKREDPPPLLLQIREDYIWNDILSSLMQKRDRQLHFTQKHKCGTWVIKNQQILPCLIKGDLQ